MVKKTGNSNFLKQYNQTILLDLIRLNKTISRARLSELTGLSPTAIGMIVGSLLQRGYIHETRTGESRGGRRPRMLELKPSAWYSIGVDIDTHCLRFVLMDLRGAIVYECQEKKQALALATDVIKCVEDTIFKILANANISLERLLGVGFSIPGMMDSETHRVVLAPNLGWIHTDLREHFHLLKEIPVFFENEAMCSAVCEDWLGCCQGIADFVCINISSGIGAGFFIGGRLYRGAGGSAGEVGHIVVDESGVMCGCGNYGCLETIASTQRILEKAVRMARQGASPKLNEIGNMEAITLEAVIQATHEGDEACRNLLLEAARYLGIAISSVVNTLNPSKIVIGKDFSKYAHLVMTQIQEIVACKALKHPASKVEIVGSGLGERSSVLGAAVLPLKALFGR